MGLSIKNEYAEELVRKLATLKGVSLVTAVTLAVEEKLAQEETPSKSLKLSRYDRLMAYAQEFSRRVPNPVHSWDIDGLLYDADGLPK